MPTVAVFAWLISVAWFALTGVITITPTRAADVTPEGIRAQKVGHYA